MTRAPATTSRRGPKRASTTPTGICMAAYTASCSAANRDSTAAVAWKRSCACSEATPRDERSNTAMPYAVMPRAHMSHARRLVCTLSSSPDTRIRTTRARHYFRRTPFRRTIAGMSRLPRAAALHVGEFAVGVVVAYAAVGGAFALTQSIWPVLAVAVILVAVAIAVEIHWGPQTTGLVAGVVATSLVATGLFAVFSLLIYRLD